jgi:hypothetical protein
MSPEELAVAAALLAALRAEGIENPDDLRVRVMAVTLGHLLASL